MQGTPSQFKCNYLQIIQSFKSETVWATLPCMKLMPNSRAVCFGQKKAPVDTRHLGFSLQSSWTEQDFQTVLSSSSEVPSRSWYKELSDTFMSLIWSPLGIQTLQCLRLFFHDFVLLYKKKQLLWGLLKKAKSPRSTVLSSCDQSVHIQIIPCNK